MKLRQLGPAIEQEIKIERLLIHPNHMKRRQFRIVSYQYCQPFSKKSIKNSISFPFKNLNLRLNTDVCIKKYCNTFCLVFDLIHCLGHPCGFFNVRKVQVLLEKASQIKDRW